MNTQTKPKRGFPSRELCLQRLEYYDAEIARRGFSEFLCEQRDWWERMLRSAIAHEQVCRQRV